MLYPDKRDIKELNFRGFLGHIYLVSATTKSSTAQKSSKKKEMVMVQFQTHNVTGWQKRGASLVEDNRGTCPAGPTGGALMEGPFEPVLALKAFANTWTEEDTSGFRTPDGRAWRCGHGNAHDVPGVTRSPRHDVKHDS
jgi:hypothetical protein